MVQRQKHAFISLISDSHTKDITHFTLVDKMYDTVVQQIVHHAERQDIYAQVHHSDVSGSVWIRCQNSTLHKLRAQPLSK